MMAALLLAQAACSSGDSASDVEAAANPRPPSARHGGEATILLGAEFAGAWPSGLDPATNITGGANVSMMNAIFGGLVQLVADEDGRNAKVRGVLAESFELADGGRSVIFKLREGVTFSDGTPFDAEAVRFNIERSLDAPCPCAPVSWPWNKDKRVTAPDSRTVALHFTQPFGPVVNAFASTNLNWIASPSALRKLGEAEFKIRPVGAGPFRVVSNQLSSMLVLERNPRYWEKGRPYLDRLIFQSIGNEQAGYQALLAGNAHAYEGMGTVSLIQQAEKTPGLTVTRQPPTSSLLVQLNTRIPPFNQQRAREAIYYATDADAISKGLFNGRNPVAQSFTAPGGLFHHDRIPGYRTYDLDKARQIVRELGGLKVTLGTLRSFIAEQVITALQSQWKQAGIEVELATYDLGNLISTFQDERWQAMLQTAGSYDPDAGSGLSFRFGSRAVFSGVSDPELDQLISDAKRTIDMAERDRTYLAIATHLSEKAYGPFIVVQSPIQVARSLRGPGLTTKIPATLMTTGVLWQEVWAVRD
jgi:peptide/nickel transport system substrate-binding protein